MWNADLQGEVVEEMKRISLSVPEEWLKLLDGTVRAGMYPNRDLKPYA